MTQETRQCQNCKNQFTIEPDDFLFYEKIKVPAPTWCPECRMVRRMVWRNERVLHKRKCDATGEVIVSIYSAEAPYAVYKSDYWRSDAWDPMICGKEYDFSRPFPDQFRELMHLMPRQGLDQRNVVNSDYTNFVANIKDSYFIFAAHDVEQCYFTSSNNARDKNCIDIMRTRHSEFCYETTNCFRCNRLVFSQYCEECSESAFLYDCKNCSRCFGCVNLRNKSYCIFNVQYTKSEYHRRLAELNIGSFSNLSDSQHQFKTLLKKLPRKFARIFRSVNSSGDDILNSKNCRFCFFAEKAEDCKHSLILIDGSRDIYDATGSGINAELNYEVTSGIGQGLFFSVKAWYSNDLYYCDSCFDSRDLFACIGLRNKQYCILNKQYTKEEYESLVLKIIKHMSDMPYIDKKGRVYKYGEFFPPELSPFAYNETIAQEYFPLTKEEAIAQGYRWKDPEKREYEITKLSEDLPDHIKDAGDEILKEIIGCAHAVISGNQSPNQRLSASCNEQCTTAFKIIPEELQFYRKMNLSLPRLCPNCRHYQRLKQRNPLRLWHRKCQCHGVTSEKRQETSAYQNTAVHQHGQNPCPNEFETSYSPERKEIVYCEQCYNVEVV